MKFKILPSLILIIFSLGLLSSCNSYRKMEFDNEALYNQRRLAGSYKKYVILVHEPKSDKVFRLNNVNFEQDTITGILSNIEPDDTLALTQKNKQIVREKVHLYLSDDQTIADLQTDSSYTEIPKAKVQKVEMFAKKKKGILGIIGTVVLIILLAILALILLIIGLVATSDTGSGGSSSSNGGGGGNSSSCYVATMVYGSTEADEVIALRRFRDQQLKKFALGRGFINWYYAHSPAFVEKYKNHTLIHKITHSLLTPFVKLLSIFQSLK